MLHLQGADFEALILDMDGVITDTATTHAAAWSRLFDRYLAEQAPPTADRQPFTLDDYRKHVDGRARLDGVEAFLASRGIHLHRGQPGDSPTAETAWALANSKDALFRNALQAEGAAVFPSTVHLLRAARATGWRTAVVTASRNRAEVLAAAGVDDLFDAAVDGDDAAGLGLAGKPDPATFLEAARRLQVAPGRAVVVEDARAGVAAAREGQFGLVIGVDRTGRAEELAAAGADVVVGDLVEVTIEQEREP